MSQPKQTAFAQYKDGSVYPYYGNDNHAFADEFGWNPDVEYAVAIDEDGTQWFYHEGNAEVGKPQK